MSTRSQPAKIRHGEVVERNGNGVGRIMLRKNDHESSVVEAVLRIVVGELDHCISRPVSKINELGTTRDRVRM